MMRTPIAGLGALVSIAGLAFGQKDAGQLQTLDARIDIEPLRVAPASWGPDGPVLAGDWIPYDEFEGPQGRALVFDCIRNTGDCDQYGYFFGTSYCNMFTTNDMTVGDETDLSRGMDQVELAWFWTADGSFTSERCIIAVFTQDSDPNLCELDSFDYPGWFFDYGSLAHGGFYFSTVDIAGLGEWGMPDGGVGSYVIAFLQEVTTSGAWVLATCAQPMLWGTGDYRGDPDAPGTQGPGQFDDDVFLDGSHTSSECYTYSYSSLCPNILGAAVGFWGYTDDGCRDSFANCDGNSEIDTQDFLCFLQAWSQAYQSGSYDPAADCDGNGSVNTEDFLCFLGEFAACF